MNLPYYVMGKVGLDVPPFRDPWVWSSPHADPFAQFGQEFGITDVALTGSYGEAWYEWLSEIMGSDPSDVSMALRVCPAMLMQAAQGCVGEFTGHWPSIEADLKRAISIALSRMDVRSMVQDNEEAFRLEYRPDAQVLFFVSMFPTMASQQPGPHFIIGKAALSDRKYLHYTIRHELAISLVEPICEDPEVQSVLPIAEQLTAEDRDAGGKGALLEAVVHVVRAASSEQPSLNEAHKPEAGGYHRILDALWMNRDALTSGVRPFIVKSIQSIGLAADQEMNSEQL